MARPANLISVEEQIAKAEKQIERGKAAEKLLPELIEKRDKLATPEGVAKLQESLQAQMERLQAHPAKAQELVPNDETVLAESDDDDDESEA